MEQPKTSVSLEPGQMLVTSDPTPDTLSGQVLQTAYARLEEQRYNRVGEAAAIYGFVSWLLAAHKTIGEQVPLAEIAALIGQYCDVQGWQLGNPGNWLEGVRPMPGLPGPQQPPSHAAYEPHKTGHHWRVEVLCDCHMHRTEVYTGEDYDRMIVRTGQMCLSTVVDKIFVWRDREKYVHIEKRGAGNEPIHESA